MMRRQEMFRANRVYLVILLGLSVFHTTWFAQSPNFIQRLTGGSIQNENFREEIPFTFVDGRICVRARINESQEENSFILDTYAPCLTGESLIESIPLDTLDLTKQMGKQLEKTLMKPLFPMYRSISLGNVIFKDIGAMAMRQDEDNPFIHVLEDGLIGANLLKFCIWQFNFQEKIIVITDRLESLNHVDNAVQIPFMPISIQQSPNVQVTLNDEDVIEVQFDTGSRGFLSLSCPSLLDLVESGECVEIHRRSVGAIHESDKTVEIYHYVKLRRLKIGEETFEDLPVGVYTTQDENEKAAGNIGIEFMKYFIVTIDWPQKQIYLGRIKNRNLKHNIRTFGLTYSYYDGAVKVDSIYGGSDVEKAQIKIGDAIVEINGRKVDKLSEDQIQEFLHGTLRFSNDTDDVLSLVFLRNGKRKKMTLHSYTLF